MNDFFYLIPIALALGLVGLAAFMWSLRNGQYDDLDGAAERVLFDDDDRPSRDRNGPGLRTLAIPPRAVHVREQQDGRLGHPHPRRAINPRDSHH